MNKKVLISSLALFIIVIIGFAIVVKNHESKELTDVLESPMANLQITSGEEIKRSYYDRGTTLGMPDYVTLHIHYQPKDNKSKSDVFDELVNNMKRVISNSNEITFDGEYDEEKINKISSGDIYSAKFSYKTHLRLHISIYEPSYDSDENTILVNIENYGRYPEYDFLMTIKDIFTI